MDTKLFNEAADSLCELDSHREPPASGRSRAEIALSALEAVSDGLIAVDLDARITFMNKAAAALTGWPENEAVGLPVLEVFRVVNATTRAVNWNPLLATLDDGEQYSLLPDSLLIGRNGIEVPVEDATAPIRDSSGRVSGATIMFHDVSFSRFMLRRAMHRALHDPLTNLPNRTLLEDRLAQSIASTRERPHCIAVLFLDLDGFKGINDYLGHATGDTILRVVAKRLAATISGSNTVSRLGGDEFVILLSDVLDESGVLLIVEAILTQFRRPIVVGEKRVTTPVSIGVAIHDDSHNVGSDLIRDADIAMYQAKAAGGDGATLFRATMASRAPRKLNLEQDLCRALQEHEFVLHYQPQVSFDTGKVVGVEALLRWNHPQDGLLLPQSFIPVAERSELIVPLGSWVLQEAARQQCLWKQQGLPSMLLSANVSAIELKSQDYLYNLDRLVREDGLDLGNLLLELTESVFLDHTERDVSILEAIRLRGIRLAIDDFGTGYSGLGYLQRFPIDVIKIDRSFTAQCVTNEHDFSLVQAIIVLGRSLGKLIVAEGVETSEQAVLLERLGCHQGQGFYFGPALSAEAFANTLQ